MEMPESEPSTTDNPSSHPLHSQISFYSSHNHTLLSSTKKHTTLAIIATYSAWITRHIAHLIALTKVRGFNKKKISPQIPKFQLSFQKTILCVFLLIDNWKPLKIFWEGLDYDICFVYYSETLEQISHLFWLIQNSICLSRTD